MSLALKPARDIVVGNQIVADDFHREMPIERRVGGGVDRAEAAPAEAVIELAARTRRPRESQARGRRWRR